MKLATVQNILSNGSPFHVRVVEHGDEYGHEMCLIHEGHKPMIEFYDVRYHFDKTSDGIILGQFVNRYYVDTIKNHEGGLDLMGGVDGWKLDADAMQSVHNLLVMWGL